MLPIYVNLEPAASTPGQLATQVLGWAAAWAWPSESAPVDAYLRPAGLRQLALPEQARQLVEEILGLLSERGTEAIDLIRAALALPRRIAEMESRPVVAILDEFQVLRDLERQKAAGRPLAILRDELSRASGGSPLLHPRDVRAP